MKTPSSDLFKFIKSLNTQEKVQFKLYASRKKTDSRYVKVFNAINTQEEYDEVAIKKIVKNEPLVKNFDSFKTYVTETILKCLQEYYSTDSVEATLCNYIQQIEILVRKCLYSPAKKIIHKAEALALSHHLHPYLLTLLSWKRRVMIAELNRKDMDKCRQELYLTESHSLEMQKNLAEYQQLYIRITGIAVFWGYNLDKNTINELNEVLQSPWLQDDATALSFPAKVLYFRILGEVFFALQDAEKSYCYFKKAIGYSLPARSSINVRINIYSKAMIMLINLKKDQELTLMKNEAVSLVKSVSNKLLTVGLSRQYQGLINNYIQYQLSKGNVREALIHSDDIQDLVKKIPSIQGFIVYFGNRSMIAFYMGDYRPALKFAIKVLANEKSGLRQDIIASIKIFTLAVHYELGNLNILPNLCKSIGHFLDKQGWLDETAKTILHFFSKIISNVSSKSERIKKFSEFKKKLEEIKMNKTVVDFDYISWAESKIKNKPFVDVIREKTGKEGNFYTIKKG